MAKKKKNIVVICGGSGGSELLEVLRGHANITAILPATDDGGSGGWVREHFNMIAPGDFRRALVALSNSKDEKFKQNFLYRYESGEMKGQVIGNLVLGIFYEETGDFDKAITEAAKMLEVKDTILPVTKDLVTLCAELEDGTIVRGEHNLSIDSKHASGFGNRDLDKKIVRLFTDPAATIHPAARRAVIEADTIILTVGDIYSSIVANLMISGVRQAFAKTKAEVVMFVNSLTIRGESEGFRASDYISTVERYIGTNIIDTAIVSTSVRAGALKQFAKAGPGIAEPDVENIPKRIKVIRSNWNTDRGPYKADPKKVLPLLKKLGVL